MRYRNVDAALRCSIALAWCVNATDNCRVLSMLTVTDDYCMPHYSNERNRGFKTLELRRHGQAGIFS